MLDLKGIDYENVFVRYDIRMESKEKPETIAAKMLPKDAVLKKVAEDIVYMKHKDVVESVKVALKTMGPVDVIDKGLVKGMDIVGELYGRGIYYLPHIMLAAKAMENGVKECEKKMTTAHVTKGTAVMHVAEGDPHDIGKNIAATLLKSNGYSVVDMGRDVPVADVVAKVAEVKPCIVTGTALMTTTMSAFPKIAERLLEQGIELPFVCAGGAVNRVFVESYPLGVYADKAMQGAKLAEKAVDGWDYKKIRAHWDALMAGKE
ncbi:MAG: cobalamin-dependent protein [Methanomassiliicoccales archaeon]|nr:cobalamin-dependent protein [Methanomassiliicoccales archaeon]